MANLPGGHTARLLQKTERAENMKFSIARDALIKPLNLVAGVVERRQTLPILSNVLLALEDKTLSLTGTDLEVELIGRVELEAAGVDGEVTVPARKLVDICKSLPEGSTIEFSLEAGKATVKAGRSRFTLSTLPAADFPCVFRSDPTDLLCSLEGNGLSILALSSSFKTGLRLKLVLIMQVELPGDKIEVRMLEMSDLPEQGIPHDRRFIAVHDLPLNGTEQRMGFSLLRGQ